jgi:hypothetical protein
VPGGKPTSTLDIVRHCIAVDVEMKEYVTGEAEVDFDEADIEASFSSGPAAGVSERDGLLGILEETARAVDAALAAVPDERWGEMLELPFGSLSVEAFAWWLVAHWYYHAGQIAYLQRCWGDLGM